MAMSPPVRLFIALWPPAAVRDALVQWQAGWQWPANATLVRPERLHATLHFLGEVPARAVFDLKHVLHVPVPAFDLHFGHAEVWPQGIAVLRPETSPTPLRALHARIGLALASVGLKADERAYRPHVTLARRAVGAKPPAHPPQVTWPVRDGFVLVQTLGGARGYEVLARFGARG